MKNKAFTLVELLAVIIILGVIALIITPKIQKTLKNSKKNIYESSAYALSREADNFYIAKRTDITQFTGCTYNFTNNSNTCTDFSFSGKKPDSGTLEIDAFGNVKFAVKFGNYCYKKNKNSSEITINEYDIETCTLNVFKLISDADNNGIISTGDEYETNGEKFYVVDANESTNDIVLLAKYNLYVGGRLAGYTYANLDETSEKYGKQSEEALGWKGSSTESIGVTMFSRKNYWESQTETYSGPNYPNVYNSNYNEKSPSDNYSIAYYVDLYKKILENQGIKIKEARLLTYQEAIGILGCNPSTNDCSSTSDEKKFVYSRQYWLGTAASNTNIFVMKDTGKIESVGYSNNTLCVRPVIVVSKDEF